MQPQQPYSPNPYPGQPYADPTAPTYADPTAPTYPGPPQSGAPYTAAPDSGAPYVGGDVPYSGIPYVGGQPYGTPVLPPGPKAPNRLPLILGAIVVLLLVAGGSFGAGYAVGNSGSDDPSPAPVSASSPAAAPETSSTTPSAPQSSAPAAASTPAGRWTGSYVCRQGPTGLTLTITGSENALSATFSFYPTEANPAAKTGEFVMTGTYRDGVLDLKGDRWIKQPGNYSMVDIRSTQVTATSISGNVVTAGCSTFSLTKS